MKGRWGAVVAVVLVLAACAGGETETARPSGAWPEGSIPTAEQLASTLITEADLEGQWTVNVPPDAEAAFSGVVPEDKRQMLPRLQLCDEARAEAREAVESLQWQAFRQLDMTPADPIDMAAEDDSGHMIFAQEFLLAGDPAEIEATFALVREGMQACLGDQPIDEGGEVMLSEPLDLPAVGEDRFGELDTVTQGPPEDPDWSTWNLNNAFVRDGPVLMWVDVTEIVAGEGVEPEMSRAEIDAIITTAAAKVG
jgi:hypothetical protein